MTKTRYHSSLVRSTSAPWRILSGLALSGFLLALPGGLLPLWGYHLQTDFATAANYFLLLGLGICAASVAAFGMRARCTPGTLLTAGCGMASVAILLLAFCAPPASLWLQFAAMFLSGVAAALVSTSIFESLAPAYENNRAGIVLQGGFFFGAGSVFAAWLLAECVENLNATRVMSITAMLPVALGVAFARLKLQRCPIQELPVANAMSDLRSVLALFFAMLLFFQFASEWAIAGWLPVFLIDRLGMSPGGAVEMLAFYWFALTLGRAVTAQLLPRFSHGRMLGVSAFCALFGCAALRFAGSSFGVVVAILFTGAGFSAIYPLAVERISTRFSYYHPGYFNGIFTFAMLGGILAPFALGHAAAAWGLEIIPLAVMVASCAVFLLILLIRLGRKVSGT